MPTYSYKIVTKDNSVTTGTARAFFKPLAKKKILKDRDGATLLYLRSEKNSFLKTEIPLLGSRFSKYDSILFFRNLATMLAAGLSMNHALSVLEEQASARGQKRVFKTITHDIENGERLSRAMKKHPRYFSDYIVESVTVGELSGRLSDTLDRISSDIEYDYELSKKIHGAMAYPIVVLCVMVLVIIGVTSFVLPQIAQLFSELNAPLPPMTATLLGGSLFVRNHPFIVAFFLGLLILCGYLSFKFERSRYALHYVFLRLPIFGEIIKEFNLARFFRAIESLFASGVSLVRSVEVARKTLKNDLYSSALETVHPILLHGSPLSDALKSFPFLFPTQTRRILEVGEKTGKLDDVFMRITSYYERSLRYKTQMLATLIEPVLIVIIGAAVGGLALSVFLPIYQLSSAF